MRLASYHANCSSSLLTRVFSLNKKNTMFFWGLLLLFIYFLLKRMFLLCSWVLTACWLEFSGAAVIHVRSPPPSPPPLLAPPAVTTFVQLVLAKSNVTYRELILLHFIFYFERALSFKKKKKLLLLPFPSGWILNPAGIDSFWGEWR